MSPAAGARVQVAIRVAVGVAAGIGLVVVINQGWVDWEAVLWDKPARVTALVSGLLGVLAARAVYARWLRGTGELVPVVPLLAAFAVLASGAYVGEVYGRTLGPDCKRGHALTIDGTCAVQPKAASR